MTCESSKSLKPIQSPGRVVRKALHVQVIIRPKHVRGYRRSEVTAEFLLVRTTNSINGGVVKGGKKAH